MYVQTGAEKGQRGLHAIKSQKLEREHYPRYGLACLSTKQKRGKTCWVLTLTACVASRAGQVLVSKGCRRPVRERNKMVFLLDTFSCMLQKSLGPAARTSTCLTLNSRLQQGGGGVFRVSTRLTDKHYWFVQYIQSMTSDIRLMSTIPSCFLRFTSDGPSHLPTCTRGAKLVAGQRWWLTHAMTLLHAAFCFGTLSKLYTCFYCSTYLF